MTTTTPLAGTAEAIELGCTATREGRVWHHFDSPPCPVHDDEAAAS